MSGEEEKSDLISRSELKKAITKIIDEEIKIDEKWAIGLKYSLKIIDNAPTVDLKDEIAGAYNEGYVCGNKEAEKAKPQDERVDISKLRLMTVEECAGHTIEYAMGWKACIEWIKGGAE